MKGKWLLFVVSFLCLSISSHSAAFKKALTPRDFIFPADHGAHPGYAIEWWYWTGVLKADNGNRYGFQLTFFRVALVPNAPERKSRWAVRDILFAHFAVSDISRKEFRHFELTGRPVLNLAGYSSRNLNVFIRNWSAREENGQMYLKAEAGQTALDLVLKALRPPVLNGDMGLSQKGPGAGNANYYYSIPRMKSAGTLTLGGKKMNVNGMAWMDHEWGTSRLAPNQEGWDWFSLRLSDGSDLMIYILRDKNGRVTPYSSGVYVNAVGKQRRLKPSDFRIQVLEKWKSPKSGGKYPSSWAISLKNESLDILVKPLFNDQELTTSGSTRVTYWEGVVEAKGKTKGKPVTGEGYVELTGYAPGPKGPRIR